MNALSICTLSHLTDHSFTYITLSEEENRSKNCKVNRPLYTISPRYSVLPIELSSQLDWRWHSSWRICECPFASVTKACYIDIVSRRVLPVWQRSRLSCMHVLLSPPVKWNPAQTTIRDLELQHSLVYWPPTLTDSYINSHLNWFKIWWKLTRVFATHAVISNELEQFMHKSVKQF
jgi:hypothetical protein